MQSQYVKGAHVPNLTLLEPSIALNVCEWRDLSVTLSMSGQDLMQHLLAQLSLSINDKCM